MSDCPCGSGKLYGACCKPYIEGKKLPPAPLALMRSRYCAYTLAKVSYLAKTMREPAAFGFDRVQIKRFAKAVKWLGLTILDAPPPCMATRGVVEFVAVYEETGSFLHEIHERSVFLYLDGRWYYTDSIPPMISRP